MLTEVEKGYLLVEAGYCCEYCKKQLLASFYEIEHIYPESRGGLTIYKNLAVSCARCNRNKGNHIEWIDPLTGSTFSLFNPREMKWSDHFNKESNEIRGKTSVGRATAALLFRSTTQFLPPDLMWDKIEDLYENQPIYYFLNHLRYRRLRNDFKTLFNQLTSPLPPTAELTPNQISLVEYARGLLLLELYFTRSRLSDVEEGIKLSQKLAIQHKSNQSRKNEISSALSVLYQQRATIKYQLGNIKGAISDQRKAYQIFINRHSVDNDFISITDDPQKIFIMLRSQALKSKYQPINFLSKDISDVQKLIPEFDDWYAFPLYSYLADIVLSTQTIKSKVSEKLYEVISEKLSTEGYGTDTDYAKTISLRRRWWVLHILYNNSWRETLISDLNLWKKVGMFNEPRELKSSIMRSKHLFREKTFKDIEYILDSGLNSKRSKNKS